MKQDLTKGNPLKLIILFAIPVLIGNIFQQLYSMVDTIIVGQFISNNALAAVGTTGAISFLVLGFAQGCTSGFSIITAQRYGANNETDVKRSIAHCIILSVIVTIILTIVATLTTDILLNMMNVPQNIYQDAYTYIYIIYLGIFASVYYNMIASIIRALGDSKTPLYFLIISSFINIVFDIVSIVYWKMGVAGAAYATVISQFISALLCTIYCYRKFPILHLKKEHFKFDLSFAKLHLNVGLPMAIQFSIIAFGIMVLQAALNVYGSEVIAAFTAASKVEMFVTLPFTTLGITIATYCGQNMGAWRWDRIKTGVNTTMVLCMICALLASLINVFGGQFFASLFMNEPSAEIINYSQTYLNTIAIFYPFLGILYIFRNALQGMGDGVVPLIGGIVEFFARIIVIALLAPSLGYFGVCLASPAAWVLCCVPMAIKYFVLMKKHKADILQVQN